jgi:hypothetical protein
MSLSLPGQDAIMYRGNRFYQGNDVSHSTCTHQDRVIPWCNWCSPPSPPHPPLLHITSTTDRTQSETSRWSHVPHSHLRNHLKSTKKKQNTPKKRFFCLVSLLMLGVDKECLCERIWCESIISYYAFKVLPLLASYLWEKMNLMVL